MYALLSSDAKQDDILLVQQPTELNNQIRQNYCKQCGKTFKHHGSLTYHRRVQHAGEKPFKCSSCDHRFALKHLAVIHQRRVHSHETPFACSHVDCGRKFHSKNALNWHVSSHTSSKDFVCHICGKRLLTSNSLAKHLQTHSGEKKHKCNFCESTFLQKINLIRHEKTHTQPFFCKSCGSTFRKKSEAKKHGSCWKRALKQPEIIDLNEAEKLLDEADI